MNLASLPIATFAKRLQTRLNEGRLADAAYDIRRIYLAMPENVGLLQLLAAVAGRQGHHGAAGRYFRRLFALDPRELKHVFQAIALPPDADIPAARIRALLVDRPDLARGYALLGTDVAGDDGIRAAILAPNDPDYLALAAAGRLSAGDTVRAKSQARRGLVLNPATHEAALALAEYHRSIGQPERALILARYALAIAPHEPRTWLTGALSAHRLSRFAEGRRMAETAAALRPNDAGYAARVATMLPHIVMSNDEMLSIRARIETLCEQDGFAPIADPLREVGTVPFALAYHGINDRALLQKLCGFYRRVCPALTMTAPHIGRARRPGPRRVAFVSEFFRDHSVYNMTEGHLRMMERDGIDVSVVQIGTLPTPVRHSLERVSDRVLAVPPVLETVRARLAALELDVLIFADVGMTAMSYFLAFARLAPLQIVLPGHPVTTGIDTIDRFFTSAWMEPEDCRDQYSETPFLVDGLAIAYAAERTRHVPVARGDVGLPEAGALYLCGQMPFKIHPDYDRVLGDILEGDPTGTVALFEAPGDFRNMTTPLLERLRSANADRPGVLDRLRVLPRMPLERYLGVMRAADVVLDTFHFNGGNTTMQSLALGQPVVTLPTAMMRGRVTLAPLTQMGMRGELEADSRDDYVDRVLRLGGDRERAEHLRSRLLESAPALIDSNTAPRALCDLILEASP